jgi:hypothetical protein
MKTVKTNYYTIEEHPKKRNVYNWIRDNWHDLNDHNVDEFIDSLNELQKNIGGHLDYSISPIPDRGEYITLKQYDKEALYMLSSESCPLTGTAWDIDIIKALKKGRIEESLNALHEIAEYTYSDESLYEICECNEYYFNIEGELM